MVRQEAAATAFALTPAQRALAYEVRQLAAEELRPVAAAGEPGRVNRELIRAMGGLGLLARLFPGGTAPGGAAGMPVLELCLLWEALAAECTAAGVAMILQGLGAYPILLSGSGEQVRRWLPALFPVAAYPG